MSMVAAHSYRRAAVVIPAHNERALLPACLRSVLAASVCARLPVTIVAVLDASTDASETLAGHFGSAVQFLSIDAHNVGAARASGFRHARRQQGGTERCWYATTDADSRVDADWLIRQLGHDADAVLGVVRAADWSGHRDEVVHRYLRGYQTTGATHPHIHGANMGFSAEAYWDVGGFRPLASGEDVDLVARFGAAGYRVASDKALSVTTSTRIRARAPSGFAHHLREIAESVDGDCA